MRNFYAHIVILISLPISLLGCEQPANSQTKSTHKRIAAADCLICPSLAKLDAQVSNPEGHFEIVSDRHSRDAKQYIFHMAHKYKETQPETITFNIHGFCETPKSKELKSLEDGYIAQFEDIAAAVQSCPNTCNINLNKAEYCAMSDMLDFQTEKWPDMSVAFQNAAIFLQGAEQGQRTVTAQSALLMSGVFTAAQSSLVYNMGHILDKPMPGKPLQENPSTELKLAVRELYDLGSSLQALHWAGLSSENVAKLGEQLVQLSQELADIEKEVYVAKTRAKVLERIDRYGLVERIVDATATLALAKHSLIKSAEVSQTPKGPNTEANANNHVKANTLDINDAAACFTLLSLNTSIVPEFSKIIKDELEACKTFSKCPTNTDKKTDIASLIERTLSTRDKDNKLMLSVRNAICK